MQDAPCVIPLCVQSLAAAPHIHFLPSQDLPSLLSLSLAGDAKWSEHSPLKLSADHMLAVCKALPHARALASLDLQVLIEHEFSSNSRSRSFQSTLHVLAILRGERA
jgi:hypothetical protein